MKYQPLFLESRQQALLDDATVNFENWIKTHEIEPT